MNEVQVLTLSDEEIFQKLEELKHMHEENSDLKRLLKIVAVDIEEEKVLCDREIAECRKQRAVLEERERCWDDRKTMLFMLLDKTGELIRESKENSTC